MGEGGVATMTPQPQHCEHECVCKDFEDYNSSYDYTPCGIRICADDTRSRPLSDELEKAYRNGFNDGQAEGMVWMTPEEEEKRIRKAERERVLDEFNWMKPMCFGRHEAVCDTRCAWVVRQRCIKLQRGELEQPLDNNPKHEKDQRPRTTESHPDN